MAVTASCPRCGWHGDSALVVVVDMGDGCLVACCPSCACEKVRVHEAPARGGAPETPMRDFPMPF